MKPLYLLLVVAAGLTAGCASAEIPSDVRIGGVFELTGTWPSEGGQAKTAAEFAVSDFNEYLADLGADWSMSMRSEDSQGLSSVALEKVQTLHGTGIDMIVGMAFSSHIQVSKGYIDANDIIIVSHASQSENLAIDDSVFRLVPNDANQSPAVAAAIKDAGIDVMVTVSRADTWGDGLRDGIASHFDGEVVKLIRYDPNSVDFSVSASVLDSVLSGLISWHGADKVGVLYVGNDEFLAIIQQMQYYPSIPQVRWFSANTQANNMELVEDPVAKEFVENVRLAATWYAESDYNTIKHKLDERFVEEYGSPPSIYGYASYDSVWLLGQSILQTQSVDPEIVAGAIPRVANHIIGAGGHLTLTEGGDLASFNLQILEVVNGTWTKYADYDAASMTLQK